MSDLPQQLDKPSRSFANQRWQQMKSYSYQLTQHRPSLPIEWVLLAIALYFTLFCNTQFWDAILRDGQFGLAGLGYALAIGFALTALHFLLLAPWLNRWTNKLVLGVMMLVATGANFYSSKFHIYFDPSMLRNMMQTDVKEAAELMSVGMVLQIVLLSAPALLLLKYIRIARQTPVAAVISRCVYVVIALVVLVVAIGSVFKDVSSFMRNNKEVRYLITPAALVWSLGSVLGADAQTHRAPRQEIANDVHLGPSWQQAAKPALMVFVVGETARAKNWGLNQGNGSAARETTPQLSQLDVINFSDMHSCGTNTAVSLPCMFSLQGRRNYDEKKIRNSESLLHVLNRSGLRVVWSENQSGCKGVCDGLEVLSPTSAQLPELCEGKQCLDMALLESTKSLMRDAKGNLILFLHQIGNHGPAYFKRHPNDFIHFTPTCETEDLSRCSQEQVANSYDNALRYTDHLLAQTIEFLKGLETQYDTALIYASDHGESLGEKGIYLHGLPYAIAPAEQTHIPMVMWFSQGFAQRQSLNVDCMKQRAQSRADHDYLFHTVLGVLDVRSQVWNANLDLSANCRKTSMD